jgi:hypothetical protein
VPPAQHRGRHAQLEAARKARRAADLLVARVAGASQRARHAARARAAHPFEREGTLMRVNVRLNDS